MTSALILGWAAVIASTTTTFAYSIVEVVATVIIGVGVLAGSIIYLRSKVAKSTIDLLKENADALQQRNKELETEVSRQNDEIEGLKKQLDVLRESITQVAAVKEMGDKLDAYQGVMVEQHQEVVQLLRGDAQRDGEHNDQP